MTLHSSEVLAHMDSIRLYHLSCRMMLLPSLKVSAIELTVIEMTHKCAECDSLCRLDAVDTRWGWEKISQECYQWGYPQPSQQWVQYCCSKTLWWQQLSRIKMLQFVNIGDRRVLFWSASHDPDCAKDCRNADGIVHHQGKGQQGGTLIVNLRLWWEALACQDSNSRLQF